MRQKFYLRHMKSETYTEGAGQQKMNSRGAKEQVPSGKPYPLTEPIAGIRVRWRSACRRYLDVVFRREAQVLRQRPMNVWAEGMLTSSGG
jgi:hypothetical protein